MVQVVNSTLDFDEVAGSMMDVLKRMFEFDALSIQLADQKQQTLNLYKAFGKHVDKDHIKQWQNLTIRLNDKDSLSAHVFQTQKPFYFTQINAETPMTPKDKEIWNIFPFCSVLMLPLHIQNKAIGCIIFYATEKNFTLSEDNISKIQRYVSHLATAINNARLAEETQKALLETKAKEQEIAHINQMVQAVN